MFHDLTCHAIETVPAGEYNHDLGIEFFQKIKSLSTAHARHDHIEDDQIDALPLFPVYIKGLATVFGGNDMIPQMVQEGRGYRDNPLFIVYQ